MLKKIYKQKSAYERYFLEADDDENNDEPKVTVNAAPRKNRGTDYTQGAENETIQVDASPRGNRGTDYTKNTEDDPGTDDNPDDTPQDNPDSPEGNDNPPDNQDNPDNPNDETGDAGGDGDTEDTPITGDEEGGGATDYTQADDQGNADTGADANQDTTETDEENSKELDEKRRKFYMYSKFVNLYNTINSFIEKIESVVKNDPIQNAVLTTVRLNLTNISDNLYDYMDIRYKSVAYKQILIFYETVIAAVKLNFDLLRANHISLKH